MHRNICCYLLYKNKANILHMSQYLHKKRYSTRQTPDKSRHPASFSMNVAVCSYMTDVASPCEIVSLMQRPQCRCGGFHEPAATSRRHRLLRGSVGSVPWWVRCCPCWEKPFLGIFAASFNYALEAKSKIFLSCWQAMIDTSQSVIIVSRAMPRLSQLCVFGNTNAKINTI